jgi:hypothetical protein
MSGSHCETVNKTKLTTGSRPTRGTINTEI